MPHCTRDPVIVPVKCCLTCLYISLAEKISPVNRFSGGAGTVSFVDTKVVAFALSVAVISIVDVTGISENK